MNRFSDFANDEQFHIMDGKKMPMNEILGKEIIVLKYRVRGTKYQDAKCPQCLTVQFTFLDSEEHRVVFTGSNVLIAQLEQYKDKLPFQTVIKKIGKYFAFS